MWVTIVSSVEQITAILASRNFKGLTRLEERAGLCLLSSDPIVPIVLSMFCYSDYSDYYSGYYSDYSHYELTALC